MEVKGTAFLARRAMLEQELGAVRSEGFIRTFAAREALFRKPVLATTRIPIDAFLRLNETMVRELYAGDEQSYFRFGEQSAAWALSGPYKRLVENRSVDEFVASAPAIYRNYFTEGTASAERRDNVVELRLDIPAPWHHVYFEYAITGYFRRGLELVTGESVGMRAAAGFSLGHDRVRYEYTLHGPRRG